MPAWPTSPRQDARELLELAPRIPLRTSFDSFPLPEANTALERLARGEVNGAAVLVVGPDAQRKGA